MKREYRVCPKKYKCVWAERAGDTGFCILAACPYGTRREKPRDADEGKKSNDKPKIC